MDIEQESLAVFDHAVRIPEVGFAFANGFDLGSAQRQAGLDLFKKEVVVAGGAVLGGVALTAGDGVARARRLLRYAAVAGRDHVAGLPRHGEYSSNFHRSIGATQP